MISQHRGPPTNPSGRESSGSERLPGLDGLRAIACLMVFAVHFGQSTKLQGQWGDFDLARLLENGNTGVALFFSLSGVVLGLPYWQASQLGQSAPRTWPYLVRRAARIVPAYFVCLTALLILNRYWNKSGVGLDVLLHYLFAFNLTSATIFSLNPPFWTIAVEVQFYLLLPLLMWAVRGGSLMRSTTLLFVLGICAYGAQYAIMSAARATLPGTSTAAPPSPVLVYSLLAHLPHFLMGLMTGALFTARNWGRAQPGPPYREVLLVVAALAVFLILATPLDDILQIPFGRYNLPYVPVLVCSIIALTPTTTLGRTILDSGPLRGIGAISYGVYIYHLPILNFCGRWMGSQAMDPREAWLAFGALSLAATLAVATFSYILIERPLLRATRSRYLSGLARLEAAPVTRQPVSPESPDAAPGWNRWPLPAHLALGIGATALVLYALSRLPGMPYNVIKLMPAGLAGAVSAFGLALACWWIAAGPFLLLNYARRLGLVALPLALAMHGFFAWASLHLTVPLPMLHKIIGSPVLGWPGALEDIARFLALHASVMLQLLGAVLLVRVLRDPATLADLILWFLWAVMLSWPLHWAVVEAAATDNLVELMRDGGSFAASSCLAVAIFCTCLAGTAVGALLADTRRRAVLLLVAVAAAALAAPMFQLGLEPLLVKYGAVFSAPQFLLSADRAHYASGTALAARYAVAFGLAVVTLALLQQWSWRRVGLAR